MALGNQASVLSMHGLLVSCINAKYNTVEDIIATHNVNNNNNLQISQSFGPCVKIPLYSTATDNVLYSINKAVWSHVTSYS